MSDVHRRRYDIAIVGSGAGGGTVAAELAPLIEDGRSVVVLEQGARLRDEEFTGREIEMAASLYEDGGAFLTADGTMTLAFGRAYGGSTVVYTGVSLLPPARVFTSWNVPGLSYADVAERAAKYVGQNNVNLLAREDINENNWLFVDGCERVGMHAEQFPLNLRGCRGSGLCNLGCPNGAKQGTNRVQLPMAERAGVEVVTRAEVLWIHERSLEVEVRPRPSDAKGNESEWPAGRHVVDADIIVLAGGSVGTSALLLRSPIARALPRAGRNFTCHPAQILVAEHPRDIRNDIGHPKSFYLDRSHEDGFVLETCMYFPFTTAKNMTGFGAEHSRFMHAFRRLQMILVLVCDKAVPSNRIAIDRAGRPVVHYTLTDDTVASLVEASRLASRIFFAAGASRVHAPAADPPAIERDQADMLDVLIDARNFIPGRVSLSAAHMMGGAAMGRDSTDSVTDAWGRVHGMPWLRIADSSLFPNSAEINPYLTVMSLADRVAEGVMQDLGTLTSPVIPSGARDLHP